MTTKLAVLLLLFCTGTITHAQDPHFTQFYVSPLYTNPANAGTGQLDGKQAARFGLQYRNQYGKRMEQTAFSYDQKSIKLKGGIGITALLDYTNRPGTLKNHNIGLNYAYQLIVNKQKNINLSSGVGFEMCFSSAQNYLFLDRNTLVTTLIPANGKDKFSRLHAGFLLTGKKFYGGFSLHNLFNSENNIFSNSNELIFTRYTLYGGYEFKINKLGITPQCMLQKQGQYSELVLNSNFNLKSFTLGAGFRMNEYYYDRHSALNGNIGYNFKNFKIMYSYDNWDTNLRKFPRYSHEFTALYFIKTKN